jgi:hypothetical protein
MNNNYIPPQNNSINIIKEKEEAKQEIKEIDTEEFFNSK